MKNVYLYIIALLFCSTSVVSFGQTYSDGCMTVEFDAIRAWNEEYEDPFANDESSWRWWFADVADQDGSGWIGGQCLQQGGFDQIGWWNHADYNVSVHTYGTPGANFTLTPQTFNLRGAYEGDDSGGQCDSNTGGAFTDDDDYRYDETVSTGINYRFGPPNSDNSFQRFTTLTANDHGSSDYGGEFTVNYTSPRPTVVTSPSQICQGQTNNVTFNMTGALSGGDYVIQTSGGTTIYAGSTATHTEPISSAGTYRVYTRNGGTLSNCYFEVEITTTDCEFNCETETQIVAAGIVTPSSDGNFNDGGSAPFFDMANYTGTTIFPVSSYISDVNVGVNFSQVGNLAAAGFQIDHIANGGANSLVNPDGDEFSGTTTVNGEVLFDDESSNTGFPFDPDAVDDHTPDLNLNDAYKWELTDTDWRMYVDNEVGNNLILNSFTVDVCACKTASFGTAFADGVTNLSLCETAGQTISLTHQGSTSVRSDNGYGNEIRWFTGSCAGTLVGTGSPLVIAQPTTTTTYYAQYFVNGEICRGPDGSTTCAEVTVTIDPAAIGGVVNNDQVLCANATPVNVALSGHTGTIVRWEGSTDASFGSITSLGNAGNTILTGVAIETGMGGSLTQTTYIRAVLGATGCPDIFSTAAQIVVEATQPIVTMNATGDCNLTNSNFVDFVDPVTREVIASINSNGQDLGSVTSTVHYHSGSAFTVPATGSCVQQQGVMNRSFVINSANAFANPVSVRLYFTDAELTDLRNVAGCGDANGCADNDDVCDIDDLYVTQITGAANEDGSFTPASLPGSGTFRLHIPADIQTGSSVPLGANYVEFSVSSFSEFWIHGSEHGTTLPVELVSLNAKAIDNEYVGIDWTTASELNNAGFELERSLDGAKFEKIAWIEGNGNSNSLNSYRYDDKNVSTATYYYRLKQVDYDGQYEYSDIVFATIYGEDKFSISPFIPNPAVNTATLKFTLLETKGIDILIYDNLGRLVDSREVNLEAGVQQVRFDTENLAAGTYSAIIKADSEVFTRKLIVSK